MQSDPHALVFAPSDEETSVLHSVLTDIRITAISPGEFSSSAVTPFAIIIDRAAPQAVKICSNLRKEPRFDGLPILALLKGATEDELSTLRSLKADVLFKPVAAKALGRYLTRLTARIVGIDAESQNGSNHRYSASTEISEAVVETAESSPGSLIPSPEIPSIPDLIPASSRLLRAGNSAIAFTGSQLCSRCRRFDCRRDDRFCSRCGLPLAVLSIPEEVLSIEPLGNHRAGVLVELANSGQNPLPVHCRITALEEIAARFFLTQAEGLLDGNSIADLLITFDARGLDLANGYSATLEIASSANGGGQRREIRIERLAKPVITPRPGYQYAIGGLTEWDFEVANKGGGILRLSRVWIEDTDLIPSTAVAVAGGQSLPIRISVPQIDFSVGLQEKAITWDFGPHGQIAVTIAVEATRPPRLIIRPAELDFGVVSTTRGPRLSLSLGNGGGEDLLIDTLYSSVDWAECSAVTPLRIGKSTHMVDLQVRGSSELSGDQAGELVIHSNSHLEEIRRVPFSVRFEVPQPYEDYIGIDFGTSASCVAILDAEKRPVVIDLEQVEQSSQIDPRIMPSALYFRTNGDVSVGREALDQAIIEPINAVTSIKRALGLRGSRTFGGRDYTATDLASEVIGQLVRLTENELFRRGHYKTPQRAVVTTPVEFLNNQRSALLDACRRIGLAMDSSSTGGIVIDEAHAAALNYLTRRAKDDGTIDAERLLIFDFGGGTLDCALIDIEGIDGRICVKTLAPGGDAGLGGDDLDWAIAREFALRAKQEFPDFDADCLTADSKRQKHKFRDPALGEAANRSRATFKHRAESAKISLSNASHVEVDIEPLLSISPSLTQPFLMNGHGPARLITNFARTDFEDVVRPFVERAVAVVETLCEKACVSPGSVSTILHVGRTSLIPIVRASINRALPNAVDRSDLIEPKLCVALGAAYWGYIKGRPHTNIEFIGITDSTIHDIGYLDVKGVKEVFVPVFPAYTELPSSKSIDFPRKDEIVLRLAESRHGSRSQADKAIEIGEVRIDGCQESGPVISVTFRIDENRVLEIAANGTVLAIMDAAER